MIIPCRRSAQAIHGAISRFVADAQTFRSLCIALGEGSLRSVRDPGFPDEPTRPA